MTVETIYDPEDIVWLSGNLSLRRLMMPEHGLSTLREHADHLSAMPKSGPLTEDTPVETLITADGYLQCLSAYSVDLRDDLLVRSTHLTMLTLGGMLALLSPQEGDLAILSYARRHAGNGSWIVDLAHRHAAELPIAELQEHLDLIHAIRAALSGHNKPKPRLWRIADIPHEALAALRAETSAIYKSRGTDAAHAHLSERTNAPDAGALGQYLKDRAARRG